MKFEVGDLVKIKNDLSMWEFCGGIYVTENMYKHKDFVAKIICVKKGIDRNEYKIDLDFGENIWSQEMFILVDKVVKEDDIIDYLRDSNGEDFDGKNFIEEVKEHKKQKDVIVLCREIVNDFKKFCGSNNECSSCSYINNNADSCKVRFTLNYIKTHNIEL